MESKDILGNIWQYNPTPSTAQGLGLSTQDIIDQLSLHGLDVNTILSRALERHLQQETLRRSREWDIARRILRELGDSAWRFEVLESTGQDPHTILLFIRKPSTANTDAIYSILTEMDPELIHYDERDSDTFEILVPSNVGERLVDAMIAQDIAVRGEYARYIERS